MAVRCELASLQMDTHHLPSPCRLWALGLQSPEAVPSPLVIGPGHGRGWLVWPPGLARVSGVWGPCPFPAPHLDFLSVHTALPSSLPRACLFVSSSLRSGTVEASGLAEPEAPEVPRVVAPGGGPASQVCPLAPLSPCGDPLLHSPLQLPGVDVWVVGTSLLGSRWLGATAGWPYRGLSVAIWGHPGRSGRCWVDGGRVAHLAEDRPALCRWGDSGPGSESAPGLAGPAVSPGRASALTALSPTGSCFWVAVLDGNVVGIVAARAHEADNTVELLRMSVDARFRGKGIAKALGRKVLEFALVHNFSAVVLGTTAVKVAAHRLYESLGFRHVGSSDRYVLPGMTLSLAERLFFQVRYHRYRLQLREE